MSSNQNALRLAGVLAQRKATPDQQQEAAAEIALVVADNEAKDALLRQAVEMLNIIDGWLRVRHLGGLSPVEKVLTEAIRQHLEAKA